MFSIGRKGIKKGPGAKNMTQEEGRGEKEDR
jgi:hypothetical protein